MQRPGVVQGAGRPSRDGINVRADQMEELAEGFRVAAEAMAAQRSPKG